MEKPKLTINIEANTKKLELKLRAISKYTEELANELKAIDEKFICECGSDTYEDDLIEETDNVIQRTCSECFEKYGFILEVKK